MEAGYTCVFPGESDSNHLLMFFNCQNLADFLGRHPSEVHCAQKSHVLGEAARPLVELPVINADPQNHQFLEESADWVMFVDGSS